MRCVVLEANPSHAANATEKPIKEAYDRDHANRRATRKIDRCRTTDAIAGITAVVATIVDRLGDMLIGASRVGVGICVKLREHDILTCEYCM